MSYDPPGAIWFIFGRDSVTGHVDIADSEDSTLFHDLPEPIAEEICRKHNAAVDRVVDYYRSIWRPE